MMGTPSISKPAIVGAGLIGASMAAMFSKAGLAVTVWDPNADSETAFRSRLKGASDQLASLGWANDGAVTWCNSLEEALADADWVQENAPETLPVKHKLYSDIETILSPQTIIASSTSALTWTELAEGMQSPSRLVTVHPFNPAHLMPLVEIYSRDNQTAAVATTLFSSLGKETVVLKQDAGGHIANRLASALWREAVHIVAEGIADVTAVDAALVHGPGLRWSIAGAHLSYHLGGGSGGIDHYLSHLGPSQEHRWASLGTPHLSADVCDALVKGVAEETDGLSVAALEDRRDQLLIEALRLRQSVGTLANNSGTTEHFRTTIGE